MGSRGSAADYPRPWWRFFQAQRPADLSQVASDDVAARFTGNTAFRWDWRNNDEIRAAGGFRARSTQTDIWKHQTNEGGYIQQSGLISLSKTRAGTRPVRDMKRELRGPSAGSGYTYEIEGGLHPNFAFDTSAFPQRFPDQEEVVSARPISAAHIRSVSDHDRDIRINWPNTPRSDLAVDHFSEPLASTREHEWPDLTDNY